MSWPSNSARTKTWGTEILTSSDLDGQFDVLHQYFIDSLNGTTGHKHTGGTNDGQQIVLTTGVTGSLPAANGGTGFSSYGVGDITAASASTTLSKVSPSSAGQALTSAGATTLPIYAGMTTQGDVEYHNGTTRTRLGPGIAGQVLKTAGAAANPSWTNSISSVSDYNTSASAFTAKQGTALVIAYGITPSISGNSTQAITNLLFTSSSTYRVFLTQIDGPFNESPSVANNSGSQFTVTNNHNDSRQFHWMAIGT